MFVLVNILPYGKNKKAQFIFCEYKKKKKTNCFKVLLGSCHRKANKVFCNASIISYKKRLRCMVHQLGPGGFTHLGGLNFFGVSHNRYNLLRFEQGRL